MTYNKEWYKKYAKKNREILNAYQRSWAKKNRDKRNLYETNWKKANPEKIKLLKRRHYLKNKVKIIEKTREYYLENKEWLNPIRKRAAKIYREKNKEQINIKIKEWAGKNKERVDRKSKEWRMKNRDRVNYLANIRHKRYKLKIDYRLNQNIGTDISHALKGAKKGKKWQTLVGYSTDTLKSHLEKQFDNKMSWGNYGTYWHIDHIKPRSLFKFNNYEDKEFKECWALKNLQPLEVKANIRKGNRYP